MPNDEKTPETPVDPILMGARPEVRKMLDILDEFFTTAHVQDREDLWMILSALRGPDQSGYADSKAEMTVYVRMAAFPKVTARKGFDVPADFITIHPMKVPTSTQAYREHFFSHILHAMKALGLKRG